PDGPYSALAGVVSGALVSDRHLHSWPPRALGTSSDFARRHSVRAVHARHVARATTGDVILGSRFRTNRAADACRLCRLGLSAVHTCRPAHSILTIRPADLRQSILVDVAPMVARHSNCGCEVGRRIVPLRIAKRTDRPLATRAFAE